MLIREAFKKLFGTIDPNLWTHPPIDLGLLAWKKLTFKQKNGQIFVSIFPNKPVFKASLTLIMKIVFFSKNVHNVIDGMFLGLFPLK